MNNGIGVCTRLLPNDPRGPFNMGMTPDHERGLKEKDHERIQSFAARDLNPDEYTIRGSLVCNSRRDFYYSRFTKDALDEVAEMLPGAPKMGAHQYGTLPMGLTYDARVIKRTDDAAMRWPERDRWAVETKYIIPNTDFGRDTVTNIDLGIFREVSLGWRCAGADCSTCGEHIYSCPHIPGDIYRGKGITEFQFSGITNVLEDSFVFRGGQKGTSTFIPEGAGERAETLAAVAGAASRLSRMVSGDVAWDSLSQLKRDGASDLRTMPNHVRAAVANWSRAAGWGLMCAEPGERGNTQAVVCERSRFETPQAAARWVREHDFRADRRTTSAKSFIFRQFDEAVGEKGSFFDEPMDEGVSARCCKREAKKDPEQKALRSLEEFFAGASSR